MRAPSAVPGTAERSAARRLVPWLTLAAAAAILLWPAVLNGYPLVYDDTGTYILSGFHPEVPVDRPVTYGLFLRVASAGSQPWLVVVAQALLLAWALQRAFSLATGRSSPGAAVALALAGACLGGAGIAASELMPDVFTALVIVSMAAVLGLELSRRDLVAFGALLWLALVVHLSHLNLAVALLLLAGGWNLAARRARFRFAPRRLALIAVITASAWLTIPTTHALMGGGFTLARGGTVFLVGRMAANGILADVLGARCAEARWRLCAYQDRLPMTTDEFAWSPSSPLYLTGGWTDENFAEFRDILRASVRTRSGLARHVREAASASAQQLLLVSPTRWIRPLADPSFYAVAETRRWLPRAFPAYMRAAQQRGALHLRWLDEVQWVALALAASALGVAGASRAARSAAARAWPFAALLVAGTVSNAVVCASLSNPQDRYQYRVVYLLLIAAMTVWGAIAARARTVERVAAGAVGAARTDPGARG